jgi:hypothetical protein
MASAYDKVKSLLKGGISRPTLYRIQFYPPKSTGFTGTSSLLTLNDYSKYLVKDCVLPGSTIVTSSVKGQNRVGVFYEQPIGVTYDETLTMTFIERSDYFVHQFFMQWLEYVTPGFKQSSRGATNIHVGYYDEFTTKLEIYKMELGKNPNPTRRNGLENTLVDKVKYIIHGVYPIDVNTIPLSSEAIDSYVATTVQFQYETFYIEYNKDNIGSRVFQSLAGDTNTQQLITTTLNQFAPVADSGLKDFVATQGTNPNGLFVGAGTPLPTPQLDTPGQGPLFFGER